MRTPIITILVFLALLAPVFSAAAMTSPGYLMSAGDVSSSGGNADAASPGYINVGNVSGQAVAVGQKESSAGYSSRQVYQSELLTMAAKSGMADGILDPANTSGSPTIVDSLIALKIAVGIISATPDQLRHGDVAPLLNGRPSPNGIINVGDAVVILERVVGLVTW